MNIFNKKEELKDLFESYKDLKSDMFNLQREKLKEGHSFVLNNSKTVNIFDYLHSSSHGDMENFKDFIILKIRLISNYRNYVPHFILYDLSGFMYEVNLNGKNISKEQKWNKSVLSILQQTQAPKNSILKIKCIKEDVNFLNQIKKRSCIENPYEIIKTCDSQFLGELNNVSIKRANHMVSLAGIPTSFKEQNDIEIFSSSFSFTQYYNDVIFIEYITKHANSNFKSFQDLQAKFNLYNEFLKFKKSKILANY